MKFVIRSDEPFRGSVQSVLTPEGKVAYTEGLTVEEYAKDRGFPVRVVDEPELDAMIAAYIDSRVTDPVEETKEQFWEALECLPPSRWHHVRGVELFHICERITADLVSWHAKLNGRFYTFNDRAGAKSDDLAAKVAAAANKER